MANNYGAYRNGQEAGVYAGRGDYQARAGVYNPQSPEFYASMNFPDAVQLANMQRSYNTPLGQVGFGTNDGNSNVYGTFAPNNYYLQALANLLMGGQR